MTSRAGVCCAAALALFCAGCIQRAPRPTAEPYLKSLRSSQNPDDLYKAAIALGNMREAKAAPLLAVHLSNKSPRVRAQVAMALGQIGDPASAPYLRKALI
ncbi:MAG: HEAT repeat domain-containing protein, partial [Elusimicrobia bacterium]|nr:HEAT repeat domain-containing protein [Elusimicrobiota bacterium]